LDFGTWVEAGGGYLAVMLAAAASLGAVLNHVREWVGMVRKPHNDLVDRVDGIEGRLEGAIKQHEEYEARFQRDLRRHEKNATESRIILRSLLTIINSSIDGSHKDELTERKEEIQQYLIEKE
jgi:hypothetical protein